MHEFSHEELQTVIKKYDSEYKRLKKQAIGNLKYEVMCFIESSQQISNLEERAVKAEQENIKLKDQVLCFQENVDRLKGNTSAFNLFPIEHI